MFRNFACISLSIVISGVLSGLVLLPILLFAFEMEYSKQKVVWVPSPILTPSIYDTKMLLLLLKLATLVGCDDFCIREMLEIECWDRSHALGIRLPFPCVPS